METLTQELETVTFFRRNYVKYPKAEPILTLKDTDEHKLPALNKLLLQIFELRKELASVGLHPTKSEKSMYKNQYRLQDTDFADADTLDCMFGIVLRCDYFDKGRETSSLGSFGFHMKVEQDGYNGTGEYADCLTISLKHLNVHPVALGSYCHHIKVLRGKSYFNDIPMEQTLDMDMSQGLSLTAADFNKAVGNACTVMQKLIRRKDKLFAIKDKTAPAGSPHVGGEGRQGDDGRTHTPTEN